MARGPVSGVTSLAVSRAIRSAPSSHVDQLESVCTYFVHLGVFPLNGPVTSVLCAVVVGDSRVYFRRVGRTINLVNPPWVRSLFFGTGCWQYLLQKNIEPGAKYQAYIFRPIPCFGRRDSARWDWSNAGGKLFSANRGAEKDECVPIAREIWREQ